MNGSKRVGGPLAKIFEAFGKILPNDDFVLSGNHASQLLGGDIGTEFAGQLDQRERTIRDSI